MSDADCTPGREPRSVAASLKLVLKRYEMSARFMSVFALHVIEVVFLSK